MAAQLGHALDNLETVLAWRHLTLGNVVRLNFCTTDVNTLLLHFPWRSEPLNNRYSATHKIGEGHAYRIPRRAHRR
ncbi:hypothetical protein [Kribbella catacumbae]|uniref:hypothetical protein n=1 Tax=Kribbella catacumbae TaxID=460086 RepID=UPI0003631A4F|nr:hypothetical protein [Kribbella catacumbae]